MWKSTLSSLIRPFKEICLYFAVILILCLCVMFPRNFKFNDVKQGTCISSYKKSSVVSNVQYLRLSILLSLHK